MVGSRRRVFLVLIIDGIDLEAGVLGNIKVHELLDEVTLLHRHAGVEAVVCQVYHMLLRVPATSV